MDSGIAPLLELTTIPDLVGTNSTHTRALHTYANMSTLARMYGICHVYHAYEKWGDRMPPGHNGCQRGCYDYG